jgi:hypothetical protein
MNVWDWFDEFAYEARKHNDRERLRLVQLYHQGYQLRERDPDQAYRLFHEGQQLAQQLHEAWVVLFFDEWCGTALLHFKRDYRNVLDLVVRCALEARKPQYAQYPGRLGVFDNLIAAYLGIDPAGYGDLVRQAMDYMEGELPPEPTSQRYLLLARRRIFSLELEQIDQAMEYSQQELALADSDRDRTRAKHFQTFIYCALCMMAHARGEWDNLAEWSELGDGITRLVGHQVELSELLAWRAASARKAGEEERALRLCRSALARMKAQRMPPTRGFYEGLCAFHELGGDVPGMLAVRERELKDVSGWGRFLSECHCRIQRCRLLARLGQPLETELAAAQESAGRLRQPAPYLADIERIASPASGEA